MLLGVGEQVRSACWVLHNTAERKGEAFLPVWGAEASWEGQVFEQLCTAAIQQVHQVGVCILEALRESFSQGPQ